MHFGEYELSPSLIGLSPLPTGHPKTFQRQPVRSSTLCYQSFNLPMGRSQGFASNPTNYAPYSDSLSLRLPAPSGTATLLRLSPSYLFYPRQLLLRSPTSGTPDFHGLTGGVYKARERIHRAMADARLLAIPAS
ncbi:hypothetical protein Lal_00009767 [Lupinus albus]|nr:hypothetical protein Lal_00009668 [Lupinus albus]KAF1853400.1 hypothetical protein Lal_00009767 [Lupinus albus]